MYFRLNAQLNPDAGEVKKEGNVSQTLINGRPVKTDKLVLPWPFSLHHEGPDPLQMSDFYPHVKLMSSRLIEALKSSGVDNIELFDAEIVNAADGKKIGGYQAVNVLGLVSAADPGASKSRQLANVRSFQKLVIDESRTRGLLMFRLAESLTDIIIAEKVAKRVADGGFVDVVLEELTP